MQYLEHIYTKILCVVYLKFKYNWAYGYFIWQLSLISLIKIIVSNFN